MTASQRKRLENCQRAMIRWIYKGCNTSNESVNEITISLSKEDQDDNADDENIQQQTTEQTKTYKEKLLELDIFPVTHRLDRNMLLWGADGLYDRLYVPQLIQQETITSRTGPRIKFKRMKEPKRPKFFEKLLDKSLQETAANLFNKLRSEIRKEAHDKDSFKVKVSAILRNIDVLNERGIALDNLKLSNQLMSEQQYDNQPATSAHNTDDAATNDKDNPQYSQTIYSYSQLIDRNKRKKLPMSKES